MTMIWKASWNYNEDRYEIDSVDEDGGLGGPKQISSADGDNWTDEHGNPVNTEAFHSCEIIFIDGPRKNECVVAVPDRPR